jgi:hypothetical protein
MLFVVYNKQKHFNVEFIKLVKFNVNKLLDYQMHEQKTFDKFLYSCLLLMF